MDLFKKSIIVGVCVTPEKGLEVAQIDFDTKTLLKYGTRSLGFSINQREIADLDLFKDAVQDLFIEMQIPKNAEIVLNIPAGLFKVNDYPAALDEFQISNAIEEELLGTPLYQEKEACYSYSILPNSTIQFNKVAYTASSKSMILEIALIFKDLGYKIYGFDTSVNSTINSLMYLERVNTEPDVNWVLLVVENYCCRVFSMNGNNYIDAFEEKISIGEVLGDAENYSTVMTAVEPIIKNLPSKYLCVVSKTDIISAEMLSNKLTYSAPITYQEANAFSNEVFLNLDDSVESSVASQITLDAIGAAIYREFEPYESAKFNLFNKLLGDVYYSEQPPEITIREKTYVLSNDKLAKWFIMIAIIIIAITFLSLIILVTKINSQKQQSEDLAEKIKASNQFLKDNEDISSELFDEGDEIRVGLEHNKAIYSYYTIVGTEIPKKLWLTQLKFGNNITIEGQADNLESVYAFFRSIKDYDPESDIKLQKLGLASKSKNFALNGSNEFDTESILTSMNADFYEFRISNEPEVSKEELKKGDKKGNGLPDLEPIKE